MGEKGIVYLVGAGPGDPELLTLKALTLIQKADVIIYDALISPGVLAKIPVGIRCIPVGKRSGNHPVPQWKINQILLEEAQNGNRVVRLKGGDPFVFGRGGEELELLAENEIPFEIVPGITSAVAVPAYAGIPVTHRDYTSAFHVITGHSRKDGMDHINYQELASLKETLIFLMGVSSMPGILERLMEAGLPADTPAAVLEQGTTNLQRRVLSDVGHLAKDAEEVQIIAPAIFMIGKVCTLAEEFEWAELRPMGRKRILLCTSGSTSSRLAPMLTAEGAEVTSLPVIQQRKREDSSEFLRTVQAMLNENNSAYVVLTSPFGVETFFSLLQESKLDLRDLFIHQNIKFAAIGKQTAAVMRHFGIQADVMPSVYSGKDLGKVLLEEVPQDASFWLYRSAKADTELYDLLTQAGRKVEEISIYDIDFLTQHPAFPLVTDWVWQKKWSCVAFTSASSVEGFLKCMPEIDFSNLRAVCIGEKTAASALDAGMRVFVSEQATLNSMVAKIRSLSDEEE